MKSEVCKISFDAQETITFLVENLEIDHREGMQYICKNNIYVSVSSSLSSTSLILNKSGKCAEGHITSLIGALGSDEGNVLMPICIFENKEAVSHSLTCYNMSMQWKMETVIFSIQFS